MAFHIVVLALGVITTEVDNAIWMYREMTQLGRIPVEIYREPVTFLLTFVLPIAVMVSVPATAMQGVLSWQLILFSFLFSGALLFLSIRLWYYALRQYASASS
jgi:ABC-2 type transport system permease protein